MRSVGVDVERNVDLPVSQFSQVLLATNEAEYVSAQPDDLQNEALIRVWTRKEAVLKASGLGLSVPLPSIETIRSGEVGQVDIVPVILPGKGVWLVRNIIVASGVMGAVAVEAL
jgi:4'-phosphopantetheinyl transferase